MMDGGCENLIENEQPFYTTLFGAAYLGDAAHLLRLLPNESVNLVLTSPPFALRRKKEYGNVEASRYVQWFDKFAVEIHRVLRLDGSFVIDIGGSWNRGLPTRSLYHFELLLSLAKRFHLAQEFYWYNPARLPSPAEWVTVRRIRVKDAVDPVWWLSKTPNPKADNRRVLRPYSDAMKQLLANGYKPKLRPSGHDISDKFMKRNEGAIPPNLLEIAHTESNSRYLAACRGAGIKPHPARFPVALPEFFIKMLTDEGDLVLDPFAGSNATGEAAERLGRRWLAFDNVETYLRGSMYRFENPRVGEMETIQNPASAHQLMLIQERAKAVSGATASPYS